ncbi:MAG: glycosyltransferase [Phycisphaeraceae bacterium]|nr:glycosyltransferase [Phycisphaeraceae bacterium]
MKAAASQPHILINALSVSSGGGFTVCRELVRGLASARPDWKFTIVMTEGSAFHEPMKSERFGENTKILWAPPKTAKILSRVLYENLALVRWARDNAVSAVIQLNGQKVARLKLPTISHAQDPVPYLPRMWQNKGLKARFGAMLRRRAVRSALKHADCMGFTSAYLRDLICNWERISPARTEVFYNAVPEDWCTREDSRMPALASRPRQVLTVSDVTPHKRQHLIAEAVCVLRREKGFEDITYRVVGRIFDAAYAESINEMGRAIRSADGAIEKPVVELVGRLSGDELAAAFMHARCFAFMSVCESFGIPPLEAMSFGTPVVSSDCCAMPEVLGPAAAYVKMDDARQLKDVLRRVLTDDAAADEMRKKGFEQFRKFRWNDTVKKMASVLDAMVEQASPSLRPAARD